MTKKRKLKQLKIKPDGEEVFKFNSNPLAVFAIMVGLAAIIVGIYFKWKGLTSSGVTQGGYGRPYGTGTLNGDGILICGGIILGFGLVISVSKKRT